MYFFFFFTVRTRASAGASETEEDGGLGRLAADSVGDHHPPTSPAGLSTTSSSLNDDKERKRIKNVLLILHRQICFHREASLFLHPVTKAVAADYDLYIRRPTDLTSIKKMVENGTIRSLAEFESQIYLMFTNAFMYNGGNDVVFGKAREMFKHTVEVLNEHKRTTEGELQSLHLTLHSALLRTIFENR